MKKLIFIFLIFLCITGCGKYTQSDAVKDLNNKLQKCDGYNIVGILELWKGESKYIYSVESSYEEKDNFKVSLVNQSNNHEQIIIRNDEGIFVLTPSLNKSFKFQSEWPYNNSQVYLIQPLLDDIKSDNDKKFETKKDEYIFITKVAYANDKKLSSQKIYFDKKMNLKKVEVYDDDNNIQIKFTVKDINFKAKFDDNFFKLENNFEKNTVKEEKTTAKIDEVLYPMYMPAETYLSSQDKLEIDDGERLILTFSGESPFTIVQETNNMNQLSTDYVYGDPYMILGSVGAVNDYSVSWSNNGVDYYVISDSMSSDELVSVAESINISTVGK